MEISGHVCRLRSNQRCLSETFLLPFLHWHVPSTKGGHADIYCNQYFSPLKLLCRLLLVLNVKEARPVLQSSFKKKQQQKAILKHIGISS